MYIEIEDDCARLICIKIVLYILYNCLLFLIHIAALRLIFFYENDDGIIQVSAADYINLRSYSVNKVLIHSVTMGWQ